MLETQTILQTSNLINEIPFVDITQDDCCIKLKENITINEIKMDPIRLTNLNFNELNYAKTKLNQFDEQLQEQLKKPFIIKQSHWYTTGLSVIGGILLTIILYNLLKWCGIFQLFRRLCCFAKEPRNTKSCLPCLQIFNQCSTYPTQQPADVRYDVENQHIIYPLPYHIDEQQSEEGKSESLRRSRRLQNKVKIQQC